jgi:hypothetical protein
MAVRIDKDNKTTKEQWLRKYADNVETVVERVPEYSFPKYSSFSGPDKFTDNASQITYHITCVEKYKVTLSSDTIDYLCQVHDMAHGQPRDPYNQYNQYGSSYDNSPAERWIRSRMQDDRDEEKKRNNNPTLKEAWDQYQFLKKLCGE